MIITGKITEIKSDGYERYIEIKTNINNDRCLWCYFVEPSEYLEFDSKPNTIKIGDQIKLRLSIEWVNKINEISENNIEKFKQPIKDSSHILANASVIEIIDDYTMICSIGELKDVLIELETKITNINLGSKISFTGNLKGELLERH